MLYWPEATNLGDLMPWRISLLIYIYMYIIIMYTYVYIYIHTYTYLYIYIYIHMILYYLGLQGMMEFHSTFGHGHGLVVLGEKSLQLRVKLSALGHMVSP